VDDESEDAHRLALSQPAGAKRFFGNTPTPLTTPIHSRQMSEPKERSSAYEASFRTELARSEHVVSILTGTLEIIPIKGVHLSATARRSWYDYAMEMKNSQRFRFGLLRIQRGTRNHLVKTASKSSLSAFK
jgi:hypothetical protein